MITAPSENDKIVRVNVIAQAKKDENPAFLTPSSYTGSPEDLGAGLTRSSRLMSSATPPAG